MNIESLSALKRQMDSEVSARSLHGNEGIHGLEEQDVEQTRAMLYGGRPKVFARFYVDAYADDVESDKQGYPVFKERVVVFLQATDSKDSQTHIVDDDLKQRFAKEWELFLRNYDSRKLPLTAIPQASPAIIKTFESMGLRCLEDVIAKQDMPEPFHKYQKWALWIKSAHEASYGRKMKVAA